MKFPNIVRITLLVVLILIVYSPLFQNHFLRTWDDNRYILDNPHIKGLDPGDIASLFTLYYDGHYHPLTLLSLAFDHAVGGLDPAVYHSTNLILHLLNTLLVFWLVALLVRKKGSAIPLAASLLFGLASMHVESVAWASERKNVLYTFFYLLSVIAYIKYSMRPRNWMYLVSLGLFVLSLLSKAMALPLCFTLVAIDLLQQRDLRDKRVLVEKVPYFALAVVFGIISVLAQKSSWGDTLSQEHYSYWERTLFASWAFVNYVGKLLVPLKLSGFYPYPATTDSTVILRGLASGALIAVLVAWLVKTFRKFDLLRFGALFFMINIFLLLKLFEVPAGDYIFADRYAYVSSIGLFIVISVLFDRGRKQKGGVRILSWVVLAGLLVFSGVQTNARVRVFADDLSFYSDILKNYPESGVAHTNRGAIYREQGRHRKALNDFNAVIALGNAGYKEYSNRGNAYMALGDFPKAKADLNRAVALRDSDPRIMASYAFVLLQMNDFNGAKSWYDKAIQRDATRSEYFQNRGTASYSLGDLEGAYRDYSVAIQLDPENVNALFNRGLSLINKGDLAGAIEDLQNTLSIDPGHAQAYSNLGVAYSRSGNMEQAMDSYKKAIGLNPDFVDPYLNRGIDYLSMGAFSLALEDLNRAIALSPEFGAAYYFRGMARISLGHAGACDDFYTALKYDFKMASEKISQHCK